MSAITTRDGTRIYYKDWGAGRPVVFSHGWPLTADAWDAQMAFLGAKGYRVIAHDRRSHGRSDQTWSGNDMDTYADDLATLISTLDLHAAVLVGHSTGGGEVAHYIGRHGTGRVAKAVLVGAVPPLMLKTVANPGGLPIEVFDGWIREFSEVDYTADLKKIDVATLIIHGDDDQIVPIDASARATAKIVKNAELKVYIGGPHGLAVTHRDQLNADLLEFIRE